MSIVGFLKKKQIFRKKQSRNHKFEIENGKEKIEKENNGY